jgi:predicted NBD/HSP70 family sugar kinase
MATNHHAGSPAALRGQNAVRVLQTVRRRGPVSRPEIATETGLSKPTVNEIVDLLVRDGYVSEAVGGGEGRPLRPGPRPRLVTFRADLGHVLGIDIGGDKILAFVADLDGEILASERRRSGPPGRLGAEALMTEVVDVSRAALAKAGAPGALESVCVGTPGIIDPASGEVTLAPQLAGWEGTRPAEVLAGEFHCPVVTEKQVDLAVIGERWRGAAQGIDDAVYFQVGIGIGAGVMIGGDIHRGAQGAAGEVGYLPVDGHDEQPQLGFGRFEWSASGMAFARMGRAAAARPDGRQLAELAGGDPEAVDAKVVFAAAAQGNRAAAAIVDKLVGRLAKGVAALVCVLNPTTVIVGGGVSRAGAELMGPLRRQLSELVPIAPDLVLSVLGDEAVALGAIRRATQVVENRLLSAIAMGGAR